MASRSRGTEGSARLVRAVYFLTLLMGGLFCWTETARAEDLPRESVSVPRFLLARPMPSTAAAAQELPLVLRTQLERDAVAPGAGPVAWLTVLGAPLAQGRAVPAGGVRLWGRSPGEYVLPLAGGDQRLIVLGVGALDGRGHLVTRAAVSRALPPELSLDTTRTGEEARRFVLIGPGSLLHTSLSLMSVDGQEDFVDTLQAIPLASSACPSAWRSWLQEGLACAQTPPIRIATDLVDRNHPAIAHRSILGEVGGQLWLKVERQTMVPFVIGAPTELERNGPGRYRADLRARVVRTFAGGPPSVGVNDAEARRIVRDEVAAASRMWGQCGVHLGLLGQVEVVDPPTITMVTIGCGRGLPASGGELGFRVNGRKVQLRTREGELPRSVALKLAARLRNFGLRVTLYRNARPSRAAHESYDLVIKDRRGRPAQLTLPPEGLTSDPTLGACVAELDLADGLEHFTDETAGTGTGEERVLLRALSDDEPSTIELIVVPVFGGLGRIGESFIYTSGGSIDSALILDRTGIRAGARSLTLAHELGHILLDLPGHPDDFGVDTPSSLMDADAADATIFGPRRLSLPDCRRALLQSGAKAPVPLLRPWPLSEPPDMDAGQ